MEFDIKLDYTMDDFQAYWQVFIRKKPDQEQKEPERVSAKQMAGLGVFFLAAGVLTWTVMKSVTMTVLEIILGVFLLVGSRRVAEPQSPSYSRWTRQMWKKHQAAGELYNCCFTEDGVWVHDCKSDHRYDYASLEALWEDESRFYLVLSTRLGACVLRKDAFSRGNPEDLPAFWQSVTGKTVQRVK